MMVSYEGKVRFDGTQTHTILVKYTITRLLAAHVAFLLHGVSRTVALLQVVLYTDRLCADLPEKQRIHQDIQAEKKRN